jgi:hypothetical protein
MKRTIFGALIAIAVFTILCSFSLRPSKPFGRIHVDVTITSAEGCTFHIVGDVTYSIIPPRITDFDGSVTIGGGKNCPRGTFNFTRVTGTISENKEVTSLTLEAGDPEALDVLAQPDVDSQLRAHISTLIQ